MRTAALRQRILLFSWNKIHLKSLYGELPIYRGVTRPLAKGGQGNEDFSLACERSERGSRGRSPRKLTGFSFIFTPRSWLVVHIIWNLITTPFLPPSFSLLSSPFPPSFLFFFSLFFFPLPFFSFSFLLFLFSFLLSLPFSSLLFLFSSLFFSLFFFPSFFSFSSLFPPSFLSFLFSLFLFLFPLFFLSLSFFLFSLFLFSFLFSFLPFPCPLFFLPRLQNFSREFSKGGRVAHLAHPWLRHCFQT